MPRQPSRARVNLAQLDIALNHAAAQGLAIKGGRGPAAVRLAPPFPCETGIRGASLQGNTAVQHEGHHTMSRRREANRAEAIVRGVGAIMLVLLLLGLTQVLPQILKGKDTHEVMSTIMQIIMGFAILSGSVAVIGLIVWVTVMKGRRK